MKDSFKRILVTGGAGFLGSHLCERLLEGGTRSSASTIASPARKPQHRAPARQSALRVRCATTSPSRCTSRSTRSTTSPARPRRSTTSTIRCRRRRPRCTARSTCSGWRSGCKAQDPAGVDQRGLRRPERASAAGELLGQRQSDRPALLLRRRQALRRDAVLRLPPPAPAARSRSRASSTPTARACIPNDGRVVSNFIVQALRGEPITIFGDGKQTRSFCYVDDLIDGLVAHDGHAPMISPGRSTSATRTSSPSANWPSR